jgi:hypothetical protein
MNIHAPEASGMNRHLCTALVAACLQLPAGTLLAEEAAPAAAEQAGGKTGLNCIPLQRIQSTRVLDDQTILFELTGKETLVNRLPHRCPGLGFEKGFGYKTSISQLCSQDIIWVLTHMGSGLERGASCGLGSFEPYVAPEKPEAPKDTGKLDPL